MTAEPNRYVPIRRVELVFGLLYGAGVEVAPFEELLRDQLDDFGYEVGWPSSPRQRVPPRVC